MPVVAVARSSVRYELGLQPLAYDALIGPLQDQMLRFISRIKRVVADAEDALQEALRIVNSQRTMGRCFARPNSTPYRYRLSLLAQMAA